MLGNNYKFKIFKVMAFTSKTRVGHFFYWALLLIFVLEDIMFIFYLST